MQTFLMQGDVQPPKSCTYTFRLKKGPKLSIFRSQNANWNFHRQGRHQPPKNKLRFKKGPENEHLLVLKCKNIQLKWACNLQKYTYEFRLKRAWN